MDPADRPLGELEKSVLSCREVGRDAGSFAAALEAALRGACRKPADEQRFRRGAS